MGSAHDEAELELLKVVAQQRLAAGPGVLNLGPGFGGGGGGPLPIISSRMGHLLDGLARGYDVLEFGRATSGTRRPDRLVYPQVHPHRYGRPPDV